MGGKTKQSQRTKNNVRPSSSGRSAELLQGALKLPSAAAIFPSAGGGVFPALAHTADAALAPDLALAFKKLNKKDPITKTKALQELTELVSTSDIEDVVAALPSWTHFYKTLSVDTDRKVREVTQVCHGALAGRCGRRLAPWLRKLLPAWLQAQHDDHAPAQAHAQRSLQATFPEAKLPEVLAFCRKEVMAHLGDALQGVDDAARAEESAEARAERLARRVSSALRGLHFFATRLPQQHQPWLRDQLAPLLQAGAFWKLATHEDQHVRAAWYGAMSVLAPGLSAAQGRRLLRALLAAKEAGAAAAQLWGCLARLAHQHQEWHTWLDKRELLAKRFLALLETGGWGDARRLGDVALPLLARLPGDMLTDQFFAAFFDAVFAGLETKAVLSSKSERQAWLTSVGEYVRFAAACGAPGGVERASAAQRLWLRRVLAAAEAGDQRGAGDDLVRHSAAAMAAALRRWLERPGDAAERLARNFWQNVGATAAARAASPPDDPAAVARALDAHVLLLRALKAAADEPRRARRLRFRGDSPAAADREPAAPEGAWEPEARAAYERGLLGAAEKVCAAHWELAAARRLPAAVLPALAAALELFGGPRLLAALAGPQGPGALWPAALRPWLLDPDTRCRPVVRFAFLLLRHLPEPDREQVFADFDALPDEAVEWCLELALAHPFREMGAAAQWARGRRVRELLRRLAQRGDAAAARLLQVALTHDHRGETLVGPESVREVVSWCAAALADEQAPRLEQRAAAAAQLAAALAGDAAAEGPAYGELVAALFRLSLRVPRGDARLAPETWLEVRSAWSDALASLPPARRDHLTVGALDLLRDCVHAPTSEVDAASVEHAADLAARLAAGDASAALSVARGALAPPPDAERAAELVAEHALRCACLAGALSCPLAAPAGGPELAREPLLAHARACLFRAALVHALLRRARGPAADDSRDAPDDADDKPGAVGAGDRLAAKDESIATDEAVDEPARSTDATDPPVGANDPVDGSDEPAANDADDSTGTADWLALPALAQEAARVLHDHAVFAELHRGYAFWEHHGDIETTLRRLETLAEEICSCAKDAGGAPAVLAALERSAAERGRHWARARARWAGALGGAPGAAGAAPDRRLEDIVTGDGFFHNLQAEAERGSDEEARLRARFLAAVRALAVAHAHEPPVLERLARAALGPRGAGGLEALVELHYAHAHVMLFDRDVSRAPWAQAAGAAAVADYLRECVEARGWELPAHHWDFVAIALCSLLDSAERSAASWDRTEVALVWCAVLRLLLAAQRFVAALPKRFLTREPPAHLGALPAEWRDVFAPALQRGLYACVLRVLADDGGMSANRAAVVGALCGCAREAQWARLDVAQRDGPLRLSALVGAACAALERPAPYAVQCLAYYTLVALDEPLVLEDAAKLAAWSDRASDEDAECPPPEFALAYFTPALGRMLQRVDAALAHVRVCEEMCEPAPHSGEHGAALGCLLAAAALLRTCRLQRDDLAQHYVAAAARLAPAEPLLLAALRLLPAALAAAAQEPGERASLARFAPLFTDELELDAGAPPDAAPVGRAACRTLFLLLAGPWAGLARGWCGAAVARRAAVLRLVARQCVSPELRRRQLAAVQARAGELRDARLTLHRAAGEVCVALQLDERRVELAVALADDHPLRLPTLSAPGAVAAPRAHWIAHYLAYQNGSLVNALKMWISAVTARVESAPQCYICYCRLHPATGRLPSVPCHQCRNKFHSQCLRKWFVSSNKSNCPLCRANF